MGDTVATKAQSGFANIYFPVVLSIPQTTEVVATYSTQDECAAAGRDYVPVTNGTVLFQAGQATATITVQVIGSIVPEGNLDFFVNLTEISPTVDPIAQGLTEAINIGQSDPALAPGGATAPSLTVTSSRPDYRQRDRAGLSGANPSITSPSTCRFLPPSR